MKKHLSKKRVVLAALVAIVLAIASGVAYAYWTASGSGNGTAAAALPAGTITVNQTSVLTSMYPGDSAQTLSGDFDNANSGAAYVASVTASISSVTKAVGAVGACDATDFTLANATATVNAEIPAGTAQGSWTGPTIQFNDKAGVNQDGCKGATVNLHYAIS